LVDGVDGQAIEHFVEDNPEDWSQFDTETGSNLGGASDNPTDSATEGQVDAEG
jgi:hypothetical protein